MYLLYNFLTSQEGKNGTNQRAFRLNGMCRSYVVWGGRGGLFLPPPPYIVNISALTFLANSRAAMRSFMVFFTIPAICLT